MKKLGYLFALLALALTASAVEPGKPAPDVEGKDIEGMTHKLSDYKGKIVVLESINFDCPYVVNHYKTGAMPELQKWAVGKNVVWFLVNSAASGTRSHRSADAARKEMAQYKVTGKAWIDDSDGKIGKAFGLKTTPHMIVIDKEGNVAYQGAIDDKAATEGDPRQARNYVREAVEKLLAGQKPAVSQTKSYGCGIKYAAK